jgi:hypothetical protein
MTPPYNCFDSWWESGCARNQSTGFRITPQGKKFIGAAREPGCDEDESAFDEIVKKVAKAPPSRQDETPQKTCAKK